MGIKGGLFGQFCGMSVISPRDLGGFLLFSYDRSEPYMGLMKIGPEGFPF